METLRTAQEPKQDFGLAQICPLSELFVSRHLRLESHDGLLSGGLFLGCTQRTKIDSKRLSREAHKAARCRLLLVQTKVASVLLALTTGRQCLLGIFGLGPLGLQVRLVLCHVRGPRKAAFPDCRFRGMLQADLNAIQLDNALVPWAQILLAANVQGMGHRFNCGFSWLAPGSGDLSGPLLFYRRPHQLGAFKQKLERRATGSRTCSWCTRYPRSDTRPTRHTIFMETGGCAQLKHSGSFG